MDAIPLMKNKWVLTWSIGTEPTIPYGKPAVVLTYVGPNPPFISTVAYGRGNETTNRTANGRTVDTNANAYACTLGGIDRAITVRVKGTGCEAVYRRDDGEQDVVWRSDHHSEICQQKVSVFVKHLRTQGIRCKAR